MNGRSRESVLDASGGTLCHDGASEPATWRSSRSSTPTIRHCQWQVDAPLTVPAGRAPPAAARSSPLALGGCWAPWSVGRRGDSRRGYSAVDAVTHARSAVELAEQQVPASTTRRVRCLLRRHRHASRTTPGVSHAASPTERRTRGACRSQAQRRRHADGRSCDSDARRRRRDHGVRLMASDDRRARGRGARPFDVGWTVVVRSMASLPARRERVELACTLQSSRRRTGCRSTWGVPGSGRQLGGQRPTGSDEALFGDVDTRDDGTSTRRSGCHHPARRRR